MGVIVIRDECVDKAKHRALASLSSMLSAIAR
jgi:hypothetical protein